MRPPVRPARQVGHVSIYSQPANAAVFIDRARAGKTPLSRYAVSQGAHSIRLVKKGFYPVERTVRVAVDEHSSVSYTMNPIPKKRPIAFLTVGAILESNVYLDGKKIGSTPIYNRRILSAGTRLSLKR